MSISSAIRILVEPVRSLAAGSIGASYMGIGTGLSHASRILFVQNLTDATLMFSLDGVDDNFPLVAQGFLLIDVTANRTTASGAYFSENTRIYVKTISSPTTGSVYVTTFYGQTN